MPALRHGDHPLTDVVVHRRPVYSDRADALIREIAQLADSAEQAHLEELLEVEYPPASQPNLPRLERSLIAMRDRLHREAHEQRWEITD